MATRNLAVKVAALALAGGLANGCIEEDCIETYFPDTPQVTIEDSMNGRINDIALELRTDMRPFVPAEYRGIPVGDNLTIYCAPMTTSWITAQNNCKGGKEFEFFVNILDRDGNILHTYPEDMAGTLNSVREDIELSGNFDGSIVCNVWSPECAIETYIDNEGREQPLVTRPRKLIGRVEADVITEMLCPAPISPFKPVDEDDWRPAEEQ